MTSKEIDSYLRLEDKAGKELAKDDDSGGNVNARMVSEGASSMNFGLVVDSKDLATAVRNLHDELFAELDPNVFDISAHHMAAQ